MYLKKTHFLTGLLAVSMITGLQAHEKNEEPKKAIKTEKPSKFKQAIAYYKSVYGTYKDTVPLLVVPFVAYFKIKDTAEICQTDGISKGLRKIVVIWSDLLKLCK